MSVEASGREEGMGFVDGDDVYFVPQARFDEFRLSGDAAIEMRATLEPSEVEGFGPGAFQPLSFAFKGPIGPTSKGTWNGEHLVYSPPPPPTKAF